MFYNETTVSLLNKHFLTIRQKIVLWVNKTHFTVLFFMPVIIGMLFAKRLAKSDQSYLPNLFNGGLYERKAT